MLESTMERLNLFPGPDLFSIVAQLETVSASGSRLTSLHLSSTIVVQKNFALTVFLLSCNRWPKHIGFRVERPFKKVQDGKELG